MNKFVKHELKINTSFPPTLNMLQQPINPNRSRNHEAVPFPFCLLYKPLFLLFL